jgi:hypothetical protein
MMITRTRKNRKTPHSMAHSLEESTGQSKRWTCIGNDMDTYLMSEIILVKRKKSRRDPTDKCLNAQLVDI